MPVISPLNILESTPVANELPVCDDYYEEDDGFSTNSRPTTTTVTTSTSRTVVEDDSEDGEQEFERQRMGEKTNFDISGNGESSDSVSLTTAIPKAKEKGKQKKDSATVNQYRINSDKRKRGEKRNQVAEALSELAAAFKKSDEMMFSLKEKRIKMEVEAEEK
ncbi:hypothetical protein LOTGIDRAFT_157160 [Lottia gigantea]|uniref:Uncharacterized protein n=1 Tax=Lottia gigantea TaxID=225164 RepID=V4ADE2_LOTGI|nr:hypothetical protein LOTGIDRAFT_157160 [Lottia gigantea]ESP02029.1 hypothetical protein LOTGIDRAFT_157160 [Lottia gigantea]